MYLLDTNVCSRLMERDPVILAASRARSDKPAAISTVVLGELVFMAKFSEKSQDNLSRVDSFLSAMDMLVVDNETARAYGDVKASLLRHFGPKEKAKRRHTTLQQLGFDENDLWIAATALRHDLTVVSTDADFARIQEALPLKVERWHQPTNTPTP